MTEASRRAYEECAYVTIAVEDFADDFGITSDIFTAEFDSLCVASGDTTNGFQSFQFLCDPDGDSLTEYFYDNLDCSGTPTLIGETITDGNYDIGEFNGKGGRYLANKVKVKVSNCRKSGTTLTRSGAPCVALTYITGVQSCDATFEESDSITNVYVGNEFCANFPDVPVWILGQCSDTEDVMDLVYYNILPNKQNPRRACKKDDDIFLEESIFDILSNELCVPTEDIIDSINQEFSLDVDSPFLKFYTTCLL